MNLVKRVIRISMFRGWPALAAVLLAEPAQTATAEGHWAFQPVQTVAPPAVRQVAWVKTPVDRFILARLEAARLQPAAPVTREQLIRRVTIGLIGLPPTPAEVDAFTKDRAPGAYERLIDRLLESPHYGERWARHWLDLARYAESDGFEHDALRPHSWRYRDYVIHAFNEDKPYDRFIREQIAGDELWPEEPAALAATGFNLLGPDMVDSADQVQRRLNTLNDMTDTTASVFLGLTLGCARCHDHKFEPLSQRDYFGVQAFYAPALFQREFSIPGRSERAAFAAARVDYEARTERQRSEILAIEAPYQQTLFSEKLSRLSEDVQLAHRTPREQRTMEQEGTVQETALQVKVTEAEITKALSREDNARRTTLATELNRVRKPPVLPLAMVLQNTNGPAPKTFVLARGDYNNPREEVAPGFPAIVSSSQGNRARVGVHHDEAPATDPGPARRRMLADWIASPANPLTARVLVNRLWQHHFGRGLVSTPSDFGTRGQSPTHPELLDWLAGELVRRRWSVKQMHRLLLQSATYQQSSTAAAEAEAGDPGNKWFSRQARARLEGEVIRDSLLAISGRLNPERGGPSVSPPIPADITRTSKNWTASTNRADHHRRSIYVLSRRNLRFPFLEVFDAPDSNLSCPERGHSITAPQSLTLLNSDEVMAAARGTAERVLGTASSTPARIELAFRLVLGRTPGAQEKAMARDFLQATARRDPSGADALDQYRELCRALFNLNSFLYVD